MAKTNTYIGQDIEWCEKRLEEWQKFIDDNPVDQLKTRIESVNGKEVITSSIEAQGKFLQETMKNVIAMLEALDKLREKEAAKLQVRGDGELSHLAKRFTQ